MTEPFTILHATIQDVDKVVALFYEYRVWCGMPSDISGARNFLTHRLNNNESTIFVGLIDQRPAGFAQLYPVFSSVSMEPVWILNDLFVSESYRGQGVGNHLLKAATEFGEQMGALRLELETAVTNSKARTIYESAGWKEVTHQVRYYLTLQPSD